MRSPTQRRRVLWAVASLLAVGCSSADPPSAVPVPVPVTTPPVATNLTLVWSDEFDGAAGAGVDAARWSHDLGDGCAAGNCGWGNNEKEYYTDAPENVSLDGQGHLQIVAQQAPPGLTCYYGACRYTSGKISTRGKMTAAPGRVEARLKLPAGSGLWPAFWMLGSDFPSVPWPACGELDVMENKGSTPTATSSAIHRPGCSGNTPFADAIFPATMLVDWVRVYASQ